jgi:import inner membrane translocase subunit TIM21
MHLVKRAGQSEHEYKYFFVDVKGHQRIYLENADAARAKEGQSKGGFKLFGVKWA